MAFEYQGFASLGVNLNRQKYGPLDISNVFTSENDLKYYLTKGAHTEGVSKYWYESADKKVVPYPYEGQVLATVIDGVVNVYALALDAEGNFTTQEIAGKIEVDGKTVKVNDEGKIELAGLDKVETGKTYVPSLVNGVLTWAEPDTSTAEGQAQEINALKTRAAALEATVNGIEASEGVEAVKGLVEKVADNAEAIADEADARDAADKVLEGKIAEALQAAKDYADAQDDNTVYDDTALAGRVTAIEEDYLKAADKYDDTELTGRVSAIEGDYLKAADKYDDTALAARVKALEDEERYDETPLANRVTAIETAVNNETTGLGAHETRIQAMEAFWATAEDANEVVDTLKEIQEYIKSDETGAATMAGNIQKNADAIAVINGDEEGSVNKKIADAIAPLATTEALNEVKATAEAAQTADEVAAAITTAITAENLAQYAKAEDVVDNDTFGQFKTDNTSAIATAKQEAIDAAKAAEEAKGYAVAADVAKDYATKAELETHESEIANDLLAYAKTADVNTELAKKIETATISHAVAADAEAGVEAIPEGVTKEGTTLKIVVDAPTRAETIKMIADKVADVTGGESAADVKLNLEAEVTRSTAKDDAHDAALAKLNGEATVAGSVAEAKALAQKGVDDAAKVAGDLATANVAIGNNTREIETVKGTITTVNETLSGKVTNLENKDIELAGLITGLDTAVKGNATTIGEHTAAITALQNKDTELVGQINTVDGKFANYYDKDTVDTKVQDAINAIPEVDFTPYAKTADVNAALDLKANAADVYTKDEAAAEFLNQDEVDARINALINAADPEGGKAISNIQKLVEYVDANAGEIAGLVTTVDNHTTAIEKNASDITAINDAIAAIVQPKASEEITVADDGTLGIGKVDVNKLVIPTGDTLVLMGGDAGAKATE